MPLSSKSILKNHSQDNISLFTLPWQNNEWNLIGTLEDNVLRYLLGIQKVACSLH